MNKPILIRCFLISLVMSILATTVTTSTVNVPEEGESMIDLEAMDPSDLPVDASEAEIEDFFESLPTREVSGIERYAYAFTHPQIWHFFIMACLNWFIAIFASTLLVSYLNARDT
jgi:hypothetical protein